MVNRGRYHGNRLAEIIGIVLMQDKIIAEGQRGYVDEDAAPPLVELYEIGHAVLIPSQHDGMCGVEGIKTAFISLARIDKGPGRGEYRAFQVHPETIFPGIEQPVE